MFVVDVFEGSGLFELGVFKEPFESKIIAVGFFILNKQAQELLVGEISCLGMSEPFGKAVGHAEKLKRVERGKSLFIEHKKFSPASIFCFSLTRPLANRGTLTLGRFEIVVYRA